MGSTYIILARNYSDVTWTYSFQSEYFLPTLVSMIYCRFKYDMADIAMRQP